MKTSIASFSRHNRLRLVGRILLMGFGLSFMFNFLVGHLTNSGYPFNTFFFKPESKYLDFYYPYIISHDPFADVKSNVFDGMNPLAMPEIIPGQAWEINYLGPIYFPFAYWVVLPFRLFPLDAGLFLFWVVAALIFVSVCYQSIRATAGLSYTFVFAVFSYPFLFLLNRSNFEIAVFVFIYLFSRYYEKNQWVSFFSLAMAIAMKFIPLGYIFVQLSDKKYKQALFSAGMAFLLNLTAYVLYPGGVIANIRAHLFNLRISSLFYVLDGRNIAFNSNLSSGISYIFLIISPYSDLQTVSEQSGNMAKWIALGVFVFAMALFALKKMRYWEKMAVVTCLILLIPSSTADYRLLLLYVPFFLWVTSPEQSQLDGIYPFLFGLLFIPKSYVHIPAYPEVSISALLNPLLMLTMLVVIAFDKPVGREVSPVLTTKAEMNWTKRKFIAIGLICLFLIAFFIADMELNNKKTQADPGVVEELKSRAMHSDSAGDYHASIGYYSQWVLLQPGNPESHLGLAGSYLKSGRYWLSYQEYKRTIFLSSLNSVFRLEAENGIQTALASTVCDMLAKGQFKWSDLIRQEYDDSFPYLPGTGIKCENN